MARKVFIFYFVYIVVVFLANTYIFKEQFTDAIVKAVFSGVIVTLIFYIILAREEKRKDEAKK